MIKRYWFSLLDKLLTHIWSPRAYSDINISVLMFHHITDEKIVGVPDSCICSTSSFDHLITSFVDNGVHFITPYELVESNIKRGVIITFDDITDDVYLNAFPILKKHNIPFTIFVSLNLVDKERYITTSHLDEIVSSPLCTLGSHTCTHTCLRESVNLENEIIISRKKLIEKFGKPVDFFAYPYGKHSAVTLRVRDYVKKSGYKAAFGTINVPISEKSINHKYFYPRVLIDYFV